MAYHPNWLTTATPSVANGAAQSFTSGTAFQPRVGGVCALTLIATLAAALGVTESATISVCSTQNGSYTDVAQVRLAIAVLNISDIKSMGSLLIPAGYWVKITLTGSTTGTCLRWDM